MDEITKKNKLLYKINVSKFRKVLKDFGTGYMNDLKRFHFIQEVTDGYCLHCGIYDDHCQCWNDD